MANKVHSSGTSYDLRKAVRNYPENEFFTQDIIEAVPDLFKEDFDKRKHALQSLCSHLVRSGYIESLGKVQNPRTMGGALIVRYRKLPKLIDLPENEFIYLESRKIPSKKKLGRPKENKTVGKHTTLNPSKAHKPIQSLNSMLTQFGEDSVYQADFVRAFNNELTRVYSLVEKLYLELRAAKSDLKKANKSLSQISNQYKEELAELRKTVDAKASGFKMGEIVKRRPDISQIEREVGIKSTSNEYPATGEI